MTYFSYLAVVISSLISFCTSQNAVADKAPALLQSCSQTFAFPGPAVVSGVKLSPEAPYSNLSLIINWRTRVGHAEGRWGTRLIFDDAANYDPDDVMIHINTLDTFPSYAPDRDHLRQLFPVADHERPYGLLHFTNEKSPGEPDYWEAFFALVPDGWLDISCRRNMREVICTSEYLRWETISYSLQFNRSRLEHWREIREAALGWLRDHEVKGPL